MARDPKRLFARYGRQLLVEGADFAGQARLHTWTVTLAGDATPLAQAAAEACGRYLVGAGVGAAVAPSHFAAAIQALDPQLTLLAGPADAQPPVAQYFFATRAYGASVDIALLDPQPTTATLRLELGAPAPLAAAVALGAAAAELLLNAVLDLAPVPAVVVHDWRDPLAPQLHVTPQPRPSGLLAALQADAAAWTAVKAAAEAGYPAEACGLVLRQPDGALRALACANLQDRYHALDPQAFPRTARTAFRLDERQIATATANGATLLAIWHSHCDLGAYFSAEDARCAAPDGVPLYPDVSHLVVSVVAGAVQAAALYRFDPQTGGFAAEAAA